MEMQKRNTMYIFRPFVYGSLCCQSRMKANAAFRALFRKQFLQPLVDLELVVKRLCCFWRHLFQTFFATACGVERGYGMFVLHVEMCVEIKAKLLLFFFFCFLLLAPSAAQSESLYWR